MLALATSTGAAPAQPVEFTDTERTAILAHGPWPQPTQPDPSNRVSGKPEAIALGKRLFLDKRLGRWRALLRHPPRPSPTAAHAASAARCWTATPSALPLCVSTAGSAGPAPPTISWAHALLDEKELGLTPGRAARPHRRRYPALAQLYAAVFGSAPSRDPPERVLVSVAKALAAFQETIITGRTHFHDFRAAIASRKSSNGRAAGYDRLLVGGERLGDVDQHQLRRIGADAEPNTAA